MAGFTLNIAKSFLGKNVNLHLKDGSVIVNVQLADIQKDLSKREAFIKYIPYGNEDTFRIPLKSIAWVKLLDLNLIQIQGEQGS
ncbi:MAG: hypothetical protein ACPLRY_02355 [Candidatus Bathyarchaeales archaeon]